MSDPSKPTHVELHPVSEHRTPQEIAKDEAGAIGKPDLDTISKDEIQLSPAARRAPPVRGKD
jgi:hypothetical protein